MELTIDFETRSHADLKKFGAWKYNRHASTETLCLSVKVDDQASRIWIPDYWRAKVPVGTFYPLSLPEVFELIEKADTIEAHNAEFERSHWEGVCRGKHGWPALPVEKLRCSAARAAACALPRSLGEACAVLGLPTQKDLDGRQVMMRMCKPVRVRRTKCDACGGAGQSEDFEGCDACGGTGNKAVEQSWHEDVGDYVKLCNYCMRDTDAERALSKALPHMAPDELALWQLDGRMNARGVRCDREATVAWMREIARAEDALRKEWATLTNGEVKSPSQVAKTLEYFKKEFGVELSDLQKGTVADELESLAEMTP
jgi:DNA polymerase